MAIRKRRSLSGSITGSRKVNRLSDRAALLYTWMIPQADDDGRLEGNPDDIRANVVPRKEWSLGEIEQLLFEITDQELIAWYEFEGERYIQIHQWEEHQSFKGISRIPSTIPSKEQGIPVVHPIGCSSPPDRVEQSTQPVPQVKRSEVKRSEEKEYTTYTHTSPKQSFGDESVISQSDDIQEPPEDENHPTPEKDPITKCPQQEIVALYHEVLPELPKVRIWNNDQQKSLRARWKENSERQSLEWWRSFFETIRGSPFLMGKENGFQADLEWLIRPKNFAKIINGRYHHGREGQGKFTTKGIKNLEVIKRCLQKQNMSDS